MFDMKVVSLSLCLSWSLFVAMSKVAGWRGTKYICKAKKRSADSVETSTCAHVRELYCPTPAQQHPKRLKFVGPPQSLSLYVFMRNRYAMIYKFNVIIMYVFCYIYILHIYIYTEYWYDIRKFHVDSCQIMTASQCLDTWWLIGAIMPQWLHIYIYIPMCVCTKLGYTHDYRFKVACTHRIIYIYIREH